MAESQFVHVAHILIHVKWFDLLHFVDKYDTSTVRRKAHMSSGVSVTLIYSYPAHVGPRKARAQLITYGALSARLPCWMSYRRVPFFSRCCLFSFSFFPSPFLVFFVPSSQLIHELFVPDTYAILSRVQVDFALTCQPSTSANFNSNVRIAFYADA